MSTIRKTDFSEEVEAALNSQCGIDSWSFDVCESFCDCCDGSAVRVSWRGHPFECECGDDVIVREWDKEEAGDDAFEFASDVLSEVRELIVKKSSAKN